MRLDQSDLYDKNAGIVNRRLRQGCGVVVRNSGTSPSESTLIILIILGLGHL